MAEARFDETIHAPVRLRICGMLRRVDELDFAVLRDTLEVSDATLSKHLKTLASAGHVSTRKASSAGRKDSRQITWLSLTKAGRSAFDAHVRALQEIAGPAGPAD
ncbi:transcriptional regulator [Nesterenkonia sp. E16_7]|uniref:transcriptional regulator n=1 Tax=unclassified Nesterenkonia TaxID=2629769 RepID=UPI001A91E574|nr:MULTISPECIES: transcriptional regulator [unclassified Nesterenkonia]MBO0595775.1 transcriptional regulator [Nesterenkonia sp. E16_10]MBO0599626.1 transcriptional regulator [Nesterenkonia sp. E16_7]